jgi:hypothetical protein
MATSSLPKAPPSAPAIVTPGAPPMATADVARAFDLIAHFTSVFMLRTQMLQPEDLNELKTISARIRASSNL